MTPLAREQDLAAAIDAATKQQDDKDEDFAIDLTAEGGSSSEGSDAGWESEEAEEEVSALRGGVGWGVRMGEPLSPGWD